MVVFNCHQLFYPHVLGACYENFQVTLMENTSEVTESVLVLQFPFFIIFAGIYFITLVGNLGMIVLILLDS
jgi:hypothetical protein